MFSIPIAPRLQRNRFLDCRMFRFIPFVEKGLANFCRVDIINVGGFTETMKVRVSQMIIHLVLDQGGITLIRFTLFHWRS